MRVLAIDVGEKKIGLAIGDSETRMAFVRPAILVSLWSEAWPELLSLVAAEHIETIIVGWPMHANGSHSEQSSRVQEFIDAWKQRSSVPIIKRDERNTSVAVQREQQRAGRKLQRGEEDSLAAQLLLESYLSERP